MATVLPFTGIRPQPELAEKVAAPPYDVLSSEEARILAQDNPVSFLHITKPEIDLPLGVDVYSDEVYSQAGFNMTQFLEKGIFCKDLEPSFYLYRQSMTLANDEVHTQTGIFGLVSADDYENNIIRKHELTRTQKENDRVRHMQAVQAQTGPVFLTYRAEQELAALMEGQSAGEPVVDFVSDGVAHQLWQVSDKQVVDKISTRFAAVPTLFVADGHHRSAAAVRYREKCRAKYSQHTGNESHNYFMAVLFPHDQLNILGYHRVVRDLGDYDAQGFLDAVAGAYTIEPLKTAAIPGRANQFGLYLNGQWYQLNLKQEEVSKLDVTLLHDTILEPILGIEDERSDSRLDFVGGIRAKDSLEKAVDSGNFAAAIACYPVSIEQLMHAAEQDQFMPPKSTWFEPKLKSGLVFHHLGEL